MNKAILSKSVQEFISVNLRIDTSQLLFKNPVFESVTNKELVEQIVSKLKSKTKLPTWFESKNIYFPPKISIEQTSSEETARYKSRLISGKNLIDLTGGFGIDGYYFSRQFEEVVHCEMNEDLSQIASHNFRELGVKNCHFFVGDGMKFLRDTDKNYDWIYVDPSRRNQIKGKVFLMSDCLPDIPGNLNVLFSRTNRIMMKTSPLIDLSKGLSELKDVKEVHVIALKNEVKELLWILEKDFSGNVEIKSINLDRNQNQVFDFSLEKESEEECELALPLRYVFEPNSAIMKSGGFNQVGMQHKVCKLHKHSHLYTSQELKDFPGRRFEVKETIIAKGKNLKLRLKGMKANIATRNYPKKVEEIRKTYKMTDGGKDYLFFTTNRNEEKICLICEKV